METVEINGLKWNAENIVSEKIEYFTHLEAENIASSIGERLPTEEEWADLVKLGSTWDDKRKGRWFGEDHERKEKSEKSIFLPAAGIRKNDGTLFNVDLFGFYWSSNQNITNAFSFCFSDSFKPLNHDFFRLAGFSVRYVAG